MLRHAARGGHRAGGAPARGRGAGSRRFGQRGRKTLLRGRASWDPSDRVRVGRSACLRRTGGRSDRRSKLPFPVLGLYVARVSGDATVAAGRRCLSAPRCTRHREPPAHGDARGGSTLHDPMELRRAAGPLVTATKAPAGARVARVRVLLACRRSAARRGCGRHHIATSSGIRGTARRGRHWRRVAGPVRRPLR